jgi:isoleucyl-tRNA synthetase
MVSSFMDDYEPTKASRIIQDFVCDDLSNWYVRLNRRRFWKGELSDDKRAAYQTLHTCLKVCSQLMASFSPFYADRLYRDLHPNDRTSVHLSNFPNAVETLIDLSLEEEIDIAQRISSLILRIRKLENIKVRQPLQKALIPALNQGFEKQLKSVEDMIKLEVNVKELDIIGEENGMLKKSAKANFKVLGPKVGADMKLLAPAISALTSNQIALLESGSSIKVQASTETFEINAEDVEIQTADIPGWHVMSDGKLTVALDLEIDEELQSEGIARELVNKIQNLRKSKEFEVTDTINVQIQSHDYINEAIRLHNEYICGEILAREIAIVPQLLQADEIIIDQNSIEISLTK